MEHRFYALGVKVKSELIPVRIRYNKKSWVPEWIWNLVATPDCNDMMNSALFRAKEKQREELDRALYE